MRSTAPSGTNISGCLANKDPQRGWWTRPGTLVLCAIGQWRAPSGALARAARAHISRINDVDDAFTQFIDARKDAVTQDAP